MTAAVRLSEWLQVLDESYLEDFLPAGGSSVKFAVCLDPGEMREVHDAIADRVQARGLLATSVSADHVKIQLVEKLFGAIADQLPWSDLATRVLLGFAREKHWRIPDAIHPERGLVEQLDEANHLGREQISLVLQQECGRHILASRALAKDFRVAMTWLARGRLEQAVSRDIALQQITDWLGGRVTAISNMRPYQIYTRINRTNARHLLGSLCAWVRLAGHKGLVTMLDISRLVSNTRSDDGLLNYSIAAVLDAYEVLRQFIDATDDLEGFLLVVLAPPEFLDLDARGRGLGRYQALMARVYDEVRDRNHASPFGALVRVAKEAA